MRQTTDDPAKSWKEFKGPAIDFFKLFSKVKKIKGKIKNLSDSNELFLNKHVILSTRNKHQSFKYKYYFLIIGF